MLILFYFTLVYSKSPTYEPSSCKLSKMRMCVCMLKSLKAVHVSGVHCHGLHPLQVAVQLALRLLLLMTLQLYHLPPPFPPPSVTLLACSLDASPWCQLLHCTTVLFEVLYCKMKNVYFFMSYLCEKYYKSITVQYYMADCVSWVPTGRSPGERNGYSLQYSCLENPMDRGAWWATVHGAADSWTRLSD